MMTASRTFLFTTAWLAFVAGCGPSDADETSNGTGGSSAAGGASGAGGSGGSSAAAGASGASGSSGSGGSVSIIVDKNGPQQFLTWDGGSGPTKKYWSRRLELPWKNLNTGDWLDAKEQPQGAAPYATAEISKPSTSSLDVTQLVTRWLTTKENRGFYLRTNKAHALSFAGRTHADSAQHPALEVKTDQGTFQAPVLANANWSPSSFKAFDTRAKFKVNDANTLAIVLFDLSKVKGKVQSATLKLTCLELKYASVLSVFEADPPVFRVGGGVQKPTLGIAKDYLFDQGIEKHSSVLFAGDFSKLDSYGGAKKCEQIPDPKTQTVAARGKFTSGSTGASCSPRKAVVRGTGEGLPEKTEKALYARYYVYLENDWGSTVDGNKMPGWDNRFGWWNPAQGGYWQAVTGNGGSPGTGKKVWTGSRWEYHGHSLRGLGGAKTGDGNYYDDFFILAGYIYNLDQGGPFGNKLTWAGTVLAKERWFSIEQYVKMNSISGPFDKVGNGTAEKDGIYRVWVDGVLAREKTDMRWTRHPDFGLQSFWFNWYHGGTQPPKKTMHYRMNSVVIARDYIGPRKDK